LKKILRFFLIVALFATGIVLFNGEEASAGPAPNVSKIQINGISNNGQDWEPVSGDIYRANTTFNQDEYVYFRVMFTGYSNTNVLFNGGKSLYNVAKNYDTTYITSGNIVVAFERYYKVPVSAFTNGYHLKIVGYGINNGQPVWSNTVSFPVN
jgi:hypothetical protein